MTIPRNFSALRRWNNSSLANTFALRAALIAIASSLVVALISLLVIYGVEHATLHERLQEKAERLAERVEAAIGVLESATDKLSKSSMFTTALLDSPGRNIYVIPFVENYEFPIAATSGLVLCDLNGVRLAGTRAGASDCHADSPLFKRVIAEGKIHRELVALKNGHLAWTVYRGVVFPYTESVEGVVVTQLDLHDVLRPLAKDLDLEGVALVRAGSSENLVSEEVVGASSGEAAKTFLFKEMPGALPFPIEAVARDTLSPFKHKLMPLVIGYGLGSLLLVLLVAYWARRVSRRLIAPLSELTDIAQKIAATGDLKIGVPRLEAGEVGLLGRAFAVMVDTLRTSEATLESKVALRTEELRKSEAAAEAANLAKSRFLATMSHEIRTPMNGILGMAQVLLMPNLQEDEKLDYARTILTSGQTLMTLLNDILDFSKIEAGKFRLDNSVFDPGQLLRETQALFAGSARSKNLQLEQEWRGLSGQSGQRGQGGQNYRSDVQHLRQMLSNLVGNALKFTAQGWVKIEATELERKEGLAGRGEVAILEFSVSDTGIGIAAEKRGLLFQPFSQTDSSTTREYGGTGLGLSIVGHLAKLIGGEVGVDSEAGKGSRFWFRIPAEIVAAGETARQAERSLAEDVTREAELLPGFLPDSLPDSLSDSPPVVTTVKPLDLARFVALADEIIPLLAQNKFDAFGRFKELQALAFGTEIAAEIDEIGSTLKTFHFDLALASLRRVLASQTEKEPT